MSQNQVAPTWIPGVDPPQLPLLFAADRRRGDTHPSKTLPQRRETPAELLLFPFSFVVLHFALFTTLMTVPMLQKRLYLFVQLPQLVCVIHIRTIFYSTVWCLVVDISDPPSKAPSLQLPIPPMDRFFL
jgi:hypothetical protein